MAQVKYGKAQISGVVGACDVIVYPVAQSLKVSQDFEVEITKDAQGEDAAWLMRNEKYTGTFACKLLGDTAAHAATGAAFLAKGAVMTFTSGDASLLNTTWILMPGSSIDLGNTKVGDIEFAMQRYADSTQNTAFKTTPS